MKSQTYQQFMKNMDHEIRRLEDSDQPYNIGKSPFRLPFMLKQYWNATKIHN